jgi:hypothetical protein
MELLVLLVFFLAIGIAATRWGVDTREQHNNWDRL